MKKSTLYIALLSLLGLLLFSTSKLSAQNEMSVCATTVSPDAYQKLVRQAIQRSSFSAKMQAATCTLKLQPHIVRRSDGSGGLSYNDLLVSIQQLNLAFDQVGMYFEMSPPNYINNNTYFNEIALDPDPANSGNETYMARPTVVFDAVNVYYAPNAGVLYNGQIYPTNWSSFPYYKTAYNRNWTVMNNDFATDGETLAHEIGHYFNLLHTHHNYDDEGQFNNQFIPKENVSRDPNSPCYNADFAGDLVSDSPADDGDLYNKINTNCDYIGSDYDALCGLPYAPDTRNIMSYAYINATSVGCRINFTQGQSNRMVDAINNLRPELNVTCVPLPIELLDFSAKKERNSSRLQWTVIAQQIAGYQVQHSTDGQKWDDLSFIEETNNTSDQKTYEYQHLRPAIGINYYRLKSIGTDESIEISKVISLKFDQPQIAHSRIYPNPISSQQVNMDYIASSSEPISIMLYNLVGQVLVEEQHAVNTGFNQLQLNIGQLDRGIFFINVVQESNSITLKLIKQ